MSRAFNLDTAAAREANAGGKRITTTGKYVGTILAAFYEQNDKGTESVSFMFEADNKQEAGPLTIYTHNGTGEALGGYKLVNAIMTCCQLKSITTKQLPVKFYDYDAKATVEKTKEVYVEFSGKRVGFVLQEEEYQKTRGDGGIGTRIVIAAPFSAESELMAAEILDRKTTPEALGRYMDYIAKSPVRKLRNSRPASQQSSQAIAAYNAYAALDDDIPL